MTPERLRVEAADLTRPPSRLALWVRGHPGIVDVVVAVAAGLPHLLPLSLRAEDTAWWG